LIGRLIHGFLRYFKTDGPPRPVAINLIEGKLDEVVAFLDSLTCGDKSTPGTSEVYRWWDADINVNQDWYASRRKKDMGSSSE
ncbi:MAG: hypothetical protein IT210_17880, partial [Armatimonadetes bacterium]|nr:hypothetical protein [Armatimonadota bacterium]